MSPTPVHAASLQATLFDFAIGELVRQHRESFAPLWTLESWAKLMIWLALNCGCSGEREALEQFAAALGPMLTGRLRRQFFERELGDLELKLLADPAEAQVLVLPLGGAAAPEIERVAVALERVGLSERLAERDQWQVLEGLVAVPWGGAMRLIASYRNAGFEALADGAVAFFDRRSDLQRRGVAFGGESPGDGQGPAKVSTDISLVAIDRSDPEAFALADVIMRGVGAGLERYLQERPLLRECCPEQALFVNPIFNLQRYAPGEGFHRWHCDWNTSEEGTEPIRRVLAWILYCNDVSEGGTEFHWQEHHEEAVRGKLVIFPAGLSHIHRGRVSHRQTKTIATGWINAGTLAGYLERLTATP